MRNQRSIKVFRPLALTLCLVLGLAPVVSATERLERPRPLAPAGGYFAAPSEPVGPGMPPLRVQGSSPGKPANLACMSSWVNSDLLPDDFSTDVRWFDNETLIFFVWFYTTKDRPVVAEVIVQNENLGTVYQDSFTGDPLVNEPNGYFFNSQRFWDPGFYRVKVNFRQGKKRASMRFWFRVVHYEEPLL